ncbi:hypothetical protein KEM55_006840 [Ascosphaera atra]|nr:hypothetical protein KEM55_006840 [Ascosphaera atra]
MGQHSALATAFAQALPEGLKLVFRHIHSPPVQCPPLFSPLPGEEGDTTTCAKHLLLVSVPLGGTNDDATTVNEEAFAFAVEIFVYTTASLTTIFVSKADSSGCMFKAQRSSGAKSIVRTLSTVFLSHIVSLYQESKKRLVVSLFARAQSQYIFPGSASHQNKHVLDDRTLVKWWCRVFDPILRTFEPETHEGDRTLVQHSISDNDKSAEEVARPSATAYLIVPGCDRFETRTFYPTTARLDPKEKSRWLNSYPLSQVCGNPKAPPRCLVPRFPDDPKARCLEDLDNEVPGLAKQSSGDANAGQWHSVKTLDQFWELMAYRQECSSGRLVGFLWMIINPVGLTNSSPAISARSATASPADKDVGEGVTAQTKGQTEASSNDRSSQTCSGSVTGAGAVVLSEKAYKELIKEIESLDFENDDVSVESTKSVIERLTELCDAVHTGLIINGKAPKGEKEGTESAAKQTPGTTQASHILDARLIKKRKTAQSPSDGKASSLEGASSSVNADSKLAPGNEIEKDRATESTTPQAPQINVLGGSIVRKKKRKPQPE